jgi:hypothetical protein
MSEPVATINVSLSQEQIEATIQRAIEDIKAEMLAEEMEPKFCEFCNHTILDMKDSLQLTDRRDGSIKNFHSECFMNAIKRTAFGTFNVLTYNNEPEIL